MNQKAPNSSCLWCSRGGKTIPEGGGNVSLDIPSCLLQRRLQLSLALHGGQPHWLRSYGPVTQPASVCIYRSSCTKEDECLPVMQKRKYMESNQRDFLEVVTQLHG